MVPTGVAAELGVPVPPERDALVVVISHDCDILQDAANEPCVEVICGRRIAAADGNFTFGKSPRRIHLELDTPEGPVAVQLDAPRKHLLPKVSDGKPALSDAEPVRGWAIAAEHRRALKRWLADRYDRHAFPEEFEERMRRTGVQDRLPKVFADSGYSIVRVFFELDDGEVEAHDGEDDVYSLRIYLVYSTQEDARKAAAVADTAKGRIEVLFKTRCQASSTGRTMVWKWIELAEVVVLADSVMTLALANQLTHWHAEYISDRANPPQPQLTY